MIDSPSTAPADASTSALKRRGWLLGAAAAGATVVAARALPGAGSATSDAIQGEASPVAAVQRDGYQETPHVLKYYQTART
ncbi:MAG: formate dehydrogenase [Variovorax sp.]